MSQRNNFIDDHRHQESQIPIASDTTTHKKIQIPEPNPENRLQVDESLQDYRCCATRGCIWFLFLPFTLYNLAIPLITITAASSISGMTGTSSNSQSARLTVSAQGAAFAYYILIIFFIVWKIWCSKSAIYNQTHTIWGLAINIEQILESQFFRYIVSAIGAFIGLISLLAWVLCQSQTSCDLNSYPTYDVTSSETMILYQSYQMMFDQTLQAELLCPYFNAEQFYQQWSIVSKYTYNNEEYVQIRDFWNLQKQCFDTENNSQCQDICSEKSSKFALGLAILATILGIYKTITYNGPFYSEIKFLHPSFSRIKIKVYKTCIPLFVIPKFWLSTSYLIQSLPIMAEIWMACQNSNDIFEVRKKMRSDLPWDDWCNSLMPSDYEKIYKEFNQAKESLTKKSMYYELKGNRDSLNTFVQKFIFGNVRKSKWRVCCFRNNNRIVHKLEPYDLKVKLKCAIFVKKNLQMSLILSATVIFSAESIAIYEDGLRNLLQSKSLDNSIQLTEVSIKELPLLIPKSDIYPKPEEIAKRVPIRMSLSKKLWEEYCPKFPLFDHPSNIISEPEKTPKESKLDQEKASKYTPPEGESIKEKETNLDEAKLEKKLTVIYITSDPHVKKDDLSV